MAALPVCRGSQCCKLKSQQRPVPRLRTLHVNCLSQTFDHSKRVKGDLRRVYTYVGNFEHLPAWYPGVSSVQKTRGRGEQLSVNTRFQVVRKLLTWELVSTYEIIDLELNKKIVYRADSDVHSAVHHLHFMPDPNDPSFTNIRYIKSIQLKSYAGYLTPMLGGVITKIPEEALNNLAKLLISSNTPLKNIKIEDEGTRSTASRSGTTYSNWNLGQMFSGFPSGNGTGFSTAFASAAQKVTIVQDPLGYYDVLGLRQGGKLSADEIKTAYRKAAMKYHPDRVSQDEAETAQATFQKLQKAYQVLKNPEHKQLYDAGKILEEFKVEA